MQLPLYGIGTYRVTLREAFQRLEILYKAPQYWPVYDERTVFIVDFDTDIRRFHPRGSLGEGGSLPLDARIKLEVSI